MHTPKHSRLLWSIMKCNKITISIECFKKAPNGEESDIMVIYGCVFYLKQLNLMLNPLGKML